MSSSLRLALTLPCLLVLACTPAPLVTPPPQVATAATLPPPLAVAATVDETDVLDDSDPGPLPVTAADPRWGRHDAPVTIVEFGDFGCPFCARAAATTARLRETYGPERLRVVWKNNPLATHAEARPAAAVAMAVFERRGDSGFWQAHDAFFADQARLFDLAGEVAARAGTTVEELRASASWARAEAKIDADVALGKSVGVTGTPAFFINGLFLSGAQPYEKFVAVVDQQLDQARKLVAAGTPPRRVYAALVRTQKQTPPPSPSAAPTDEHSVWRITVGKSPARGKATAPVTIVEIADFQCPFCALVHPTLQQVLAEYAGRVRVVFKHNPLPFHPRAEPAAELTLEARAQKGDKGFWAAHDLLFTRECAGDPTATHRVACEKNNGTWRDHQASLADADLLVDAKALGLDVSRVQAAITNHKHAAAIAEDEALAQDFQANGTPHFFINGRRLVGAHPIEKFRALIDEELARVAVMVKQGVPPAQVYEKIMESAKTPLPPEKKSVAAPTLDNPSRGPAGARVVVQMFGDFQCPFCKQANATVAELEKLFPGKLRLVWRNLPLSMHKDAEPAAEAAMEAFAQKGDAGFWAMYELLYASQDKPEALTAKALEGYAAQLGLDPARFSDALATHAHRARIDADARAAADARIIGTPAFVINGYFVSGAQPIFRFKRIVERALAEAR